MNKQTSTLLMVVQCQNFVGMHLSIWNNDVSIHENGKSGFIQMNRSFDLSGPTELAKFRVFIYSKMEHKTNKIRGSLYISGKPDN